MENKPNKPRLFREIVKDQHTSHWDQDLLSWEELERTLAEDDQQSDVATSDKVGNKPPAPKNPQKT